MVYEPIKRAGAPRRLDENSLKRDRFDPLPADTNTKDWSAKKVAAVVEHLRKYLAGMSDSKRAYFTESRLAEVAEKAGRDYDRHMAKQALTKLGSNKRPKLR